MRLREAVPGDAEAVAAFHVAVWRETYAGIAPKVAFDTLDAARRLPGWQARLGDTQPGTVVAEDDDGIAGLVSWGAPGEALFGARGEIKHLYVAGRARRQGLGARLLEVARQGIAGAGFDGAGLAVVRENAAAIAFYRALGGREAGAFTDPGPLWKSDNILMVWPDLDP